jgi:peptidoglycan hydrolase-like protein with peptidoglycan-binding domain
MTQEPETTETETDAIEQAEAPAAAPEPAAEAKPEPKTAPRPKPAAVANAVVGTGTTDDVFLSRCVFKSRMTRKSLSVHHLQRRLTELGFRDAGSDKDGWYGDLTFKAVKEFQAANKLEASGLVDAATLEAIFAGDPNVTVIVD